MVALRSSQRQTVPVDYWPIGGAKELWSAKEREVLLEGPAGTGKTVACLNRLHRCCTKYAGMRALMVRKTQKSLKESALVTYQRKVLHPLDGVTYYGGSDSRPAAFLYPNGSEVLVAGMDNPDKIKSTEFDLIYPNEATELTENDWETLTHRLRNGVMPYQQIMADCNPDVPTHWLNQRCIAGKTRRILSRHVDNPRFFDPRRNAWTMDGLAYLDTLRSLTGVRKKRMLDGIWAAAEGQVYDQWDAAVHLVSDAELAERGFWDHLRFARVTAQDVPASVDWGWTNPGVMQVWPVDHDGRMTLIHEVYQTGKLIDWWVTKGIELREAYGVTVFVCDPSEPAYIAQLNNAGLNAVPAFNDIAPGIAAVQARLAVQADGRPRLQVREGALEQRDQALTERGQPASSVEEVGSYIWAKRGDGTIKDSPVDESNHGLDGWRYAVAYVDNLGIRPSGPTQQYSYLPDDRDEDDDPRWGGWQ